MTLKAFDDFIFDNTVIGVQGWATRIQYYTHCTPLTQAKLLVLFGGAAFSASHLAHYQVSGSAKYLADALVSAGLTLYIVFVLEYCRRFVGTAKTRNPLRALQMMRLFRLVFFGLAVIVLCSNLWSPAVLLAAALAIGFYLAACDSVPPPIVYRKPVLAT